MKTVFEWKTAFPEGYAPTMEKCLCCGAKEISFFDLAKGECFCQNCGKEHALAAQVNNDIINGIKYIRDAGMSKMLSFDMSKQGIEYLNTLSEIYLKIHLDCEFKTLEYLKK